MKYIILTSLLILSASCTHLTSVSSSSIPKDKSQRVKAESSRFMFFLFNFNNDYVDDVAEDLANQCPKGKVKGVLTKHESVTYFPLIAHQVNVKASGYCVR